jgi:hypothetical protein
MQQKDDAKKTPPSDPTDDSRKTAPPEHALPSLTVPSLGLFLVTIAAGLSFFVYVLWPEISQGPDGKLAWAKSVRVFGTAEAPISLSSEARLILLVMLAGALGSYVHAATSFVTYVGNRTLRASWTWWYLLRPVIGMVLALIFYFVIRGGLLSAGAAASEVSPFGIAAVAALVGMFSKQATDKLQEVFDNLFRTKAGEGDDQRRDKLTSRISVTEKMIPANKITALTIPDGKSSKDIKMLDLYNNYGGVVTRLPILDHRGAVLHVIHQSLVYKFICAQSVAGSKSGTAVDLAGLTLEDFLGSPGMRELVTQSIAFVSEHATLDEARTAMDKVQKCQDVFVTEHGSSEEAIKGWLTNVDVGRLSKG